MIDKPNKLGKLDAFKCQEKQYKNVYWSTCKRDLVVRDRDETETFEISSRDGLKTETSRPRPHP